MNRLFHQRFTLSYKCGIIVFSLLAFYLFWIKMTIVALLVIIVIVVIIERVIHTTYSFMAEEDADVLVIDKGRFSSKKVIRVNDIVKCIPMKTCFGLSRYLLIEYGAGHIVIVQPEDDAAFVMELKRRLSK